ncbi:MAG: hypothetical protein M1813_004981 [Trichoglossum hirsutum]|nr:MAG: hypothetical protein M1813_004981 [Trichoglossum hirsutum]
MATSYNPWLNAINIAGTTTVAPTHSGPPNTLEVPTVGTELWPVEECRPVIPNTPIEADSLAGYKWRQFELPEKELSLVEVGTPQEIRRLIRESLGKQLATREESPQDSLSGPNLQELETGYGILPVDLTDDGDHLAASQSAISGDSQHIRQDSGNSNDSTSSEVQSNRSSIRDAGLTPSTSRSSNSSRGAQSRYPKALARKSEAGSIGPLRYFGQLLAKDKMTGPHLTSPRATQFKKLWRERMSESTALMDESYFPPRCCLMEIPVKVIQGHLSFTQKLLYKRKAREYAVPAGGDPWRTCLCTEEHEAIRLQDLQRQADQEEAEAAEVAAAIASIERRQREETEEAARREEKRLRQDRLQLEREQRWRKEVKGRAGRMETERLRATAVKLDGLWIAFHRVHRMQRKALLQRHSEIDAKLAADVGEAEQAYAEAYAPEETALKNQHTEAIQRLRSTHANALRALQYQQLLEEDDYFTGGLNRNQREYGVIAKMRATHTEARDTLLARQNEENFRTNAEYTQRLREIQDSAAAARDAEKDRKRQALELQRLRHAADLMWFDLLVDVRTKIMEDLEAQMVSPKQDDTERGAAS